MSITVDTDGAAGVTTATITATEGHRFWLPDAGVWVTAAQLKTGSWLQTASGTWVQVTAVEHHTRTQAVHNLTVEGQHTYYVLAGEVAVLAHNDGGTCPVGNEVPYNSDALSSQAYNARVDANSARFPHGPNIESPGGNVAVARVQGHDQPLVGFSRGDDFHAEDDIMGQIDALRQNGRDVGGITDLYSERQPCSACAARLPGYLADNANITWSVPWFDNALMNSGSNDILARLIRRASGGR